MGDFAGEPGVRNEARLHEGGSALWSVRKVFLWLAVLTAAEVGVVYLHFLPKKAIAVLLLVGALAKAALVALHFMHLRIERRFTLWMMAVALALGAVFVLGLLPDLVFGPGAGGAGGG
ncbi:MAG: cytochrome C oxidase subunit IV family protein [Planctomycetaceae bacterium]|nr:cytochrome C oxidase subunit IV family protein [Planctomycetaceae bacterium]